MTVEGGGVEGEKIVRVWQVEVCVTGEGVKIQGSVRVSEVRKVTEEEKGKGVKAFEVDEDGGVRVIGVEEQQCRRKKSVVRVPSQAAVLHPFLQHRSVLEHKQWAKSGMVAKVVTCDSLLSIQERVKDVGFTNVVVTPMGSDKVILHCLNP